MIVSYLCFVSVFHAGQYERIRGAEFGGRDAGEAGARTDASQHACENAQQVILPRVSARARPISATRLPSLLVTAP